jgi:hypothetical protein
MKLRILIDQLIDFIKPRLTKTGDFILSVFRSVSKFWPALPIIIAIFQLFISYSQFELNKQQKITADAMTKIANQQLILLEQMKSIADAQKTITETQIGISKDQLQISRMTSQQHVIPDVDCALLVDGKSRPTLALINNSDIKVKSVSVKAYLLGLKANNEIVILLTGSQYPGYWYFAREIAIKDSILNTINNLHPPPAKMRHKWVTKYMYGFIIGYHREADMRKFEKIALFEIAMSDEGVVLEAKRIENNELKKQLKSESETLDKVIPKKPGDYLGY